MIRFKCGLNTKYGFEYDSIPAKLQNALLKALLDSGHKMLILSPNTYLCSLEPDEYGDTIMRITVGKVYYIFAVIGVSNNWHLSSDNNMLIMDFNFIINEHTGKPYEIAVSLDEIER